ncbi:excise [Mycobacterium phage Guanica15]|uniref:Excise n=1 Tax=Mycobacterium phage Yunkel11 TaxID=2599886 RepID=A0A5J6TCX1_9CAUD|nr:excisionase [Mycobacterium phage Yunkel11]QFG08435.1 excise [Mycobacterium phage Yunkel11]QFG11658.1 excise [Mycobacterium phage Guanica15]
MQNFTHELRPPTDEPLTFPLADVARLIPCSERWLTEQVRGGRIPGRKIGRHWRMTKADIDAALDSFRVSPESGRKTVAPQQDSAPGALALTATSRRRVGSR